MRKFEFSKDGQILLGISDREQDYIQVKSVLVWEVSSGKNLWRCDLALRDACLAPDGSKIAILYEKGLSSLCSVYGELGCKNTLKLL